MKKIDPNATHWIYCNHCGHSEDVGLYDTMDECIECGCDDSMIDAFTLNPDGDIAEYYAGEDFK
jgi:hypothetical protein